MGTEQEEDGDSWAERRDRCVEKEERVREEASKCRRKRCADNGPGEGDGSKSQVHPLRQTERERQMADPGLR